MIEVLEQAIREVLRLEVLTVVVCAAAFGIFVGSIPGLTATMAVALMVPLTFFLDDVSAVAAIVTTVTCSIFAGDIPATLVRIPGTPASAAYANDAYALTQQGLATRALGLSLFASVAGGLFGTLVLAFCAPQLARFATRFTSYEYVWLYLIGLSCAAIVSDRQRLKGLMSLLIGLLIATVGLGTDFSVPRFTMGVDQLITGVNFIPAMIGLFGVSEILRNVLVLGNKSQSSPRQTGISWSDLLGAPLKRISRRWIPLARSSTIGSVIGMLPGAGADMAAWISYAVSKRASRQPREYGHGSMEGLADATGANNAALGSAWIPALVLGIPGDSVTAIAIGVLLMKNITPGPQIFELPAEGEAVAGHQVVLVFSIFVTFVLANLVLIPLGLLAIRLGTWLIDIPRSVLIPLVLVFCIVGAFAMNASYFDLWVMLAMGVLGFALERLRFPLGPVVLGMILGGPLEHKLIQCLTKGESWTAFFSSSISLTLVAILALLWAMPLVRHGLSYIGNRKGAGA